MRSLLPVVSLCVVLSTCCAFAADAQWNLVWHDNFDRDEVGPDWYVCGGKASIEAGRLLLEGGGATIITERRFKADVRIEFDAEAHPGVPPCDLSATIGANKDHGYGYLFAFGGRSNQANQLLGLGVRQVDLEPPFVIEHGRVYRLVAQKEGRRLTYTVDGVKILDAETPDPVGGPGFDRVGMVTWTAMYADNFRVYERAVPHPDTPDYPESLPPTPLYRDGRLLRTKQGFVPSAGLAAALDAFNQGRLEDALANFRGLGDTLIGLVGQAYVICDLAYREKQQYRVRSQTEDFADLARRFRNASRANPSDRNLAVYARAASCLPELIMSRSGMTSAVRLTGLGEADNPFYHKARLYEARYHYWNGTEGGNQAIRQQAADWMAELKQVWPEHTVLRQYTGENVRWGEELDADTDTHPAWAAYLREAYARQIRIMERFFTERQAPDGQLGGSYGDDVELMRTWVQIAAISSAAETVRAGIEKLAEGVWENELTDGYSRNIGDVEHSAEPSADILPTMLLLRYGDPLWVLRNVRSCKTVRDMFMGIDQKGYPRFKSTEFGTDGVNTHPRAGGDTGYHARAMKHFIWQAWYGDPEARDWFARWCDGWREATMAQIDTKIPGFPPSTIWYPSGGIFPPADAPWYDDHWNYYGSFGLGNMVQDSFLCAYYLTRDLRFLRPFQYAMDLATRGPLLKGSYNPGSVEWQLQAMAHFADPQRTAIYKWLTGERVYDEYTLRGGDPAQVYRVNHDLGAFLARFEQVAKSQRNDLEFQTTEVLATDRAALSGALTVFGAYTGAVCGLRDAATPTFAVTYDTADTDFAAVVTESTSRRARVWLYSFKEEPADIGLRFWRLEPGEYFVNQGELLNGEYPFQNRYGWIEPQTVVVTHRADGVSVRVPPGKVWVVDVRLHSPVEVPEAAPDLAIASRDMHWTAEGLMVTVHNLGGADSGPCAIRMMGEGFERVEVAVPSVPAQRDFTPSSTRVLVPAPAGRAGECWVEIVHADGVYDFCPFNDRAPAPKGAQK